MNMNYRGLYTLYLKEVHRFLNVYNQTLVAPLINVMLLLATFSLVFTQHVHEVEGVPFKQFIIPGLIMMTVIQNAFANTSSTLTFSKVLGTIVDLLIPPFSAKEIIIALSCAGATRGIMTGLVVAATVTVIGLAFDPDLLIHVHHWGLAIFYLIAASMLLSLLGMLAGIQSDTFDQMSAITSFIITPLSFLSGTFYSSKNLPLFWQHINHFNPFFYIIDGFRYALTGHSDYSIQIGMAVLVGLNIVFFGITYTLLERGYKIRS